MKAEYNVGYVSPGWPLEKYPNGIVSYIKNLVDGFTEEVSSSILAYGVNPDSSDNVVNISQQRKTPLRLKVLKKLSDNFGVRTRSISNYKYSLENRANADAIISSISKNKLNLDLLEIEESFGLGYWIARHKYLNGINLVTRLHGPWFIHGPIMKKEELDTYKARVVMEGKSLEYSTGITSPSADVLERVRDFYDLPLAHAKVIPNAILPTAQEYRWSYNLCEKQHVLFVGRFDNHKGGDVAIDAFNVIASYNSDVELIFVGPDRGVLINGELLFFDEYLKMKIKDHNIRRRIKFLGHQPKSVIDKLRQNCLVTLITSRYDNFPMSVLEAMSAGSPVVAADAGGISEIIGNSSNGVVVVDSSPESLAHEVLELLSDRAKMEVFSNNSVERALEKFHPNVIASQTLSYYKSLS